MSCCARAAPALLLHVCLLLTMLSGAGLSSAARLKWDPSTYVVARELFPLEYRVAAVVLCAASAALLALAHLAALALALPPRAALARRRLLHVFAGATLVLFIAQVGWVWWTGARVAVWATGEQAQTAAEALAARDHLEPLLELVARWLPGAGRLRVLLAEAESDAPANLHVAIAALALAALLQPAAALLALLSARRPLSAPPSYSSSTSTDYEAAPLRTTYRNGKLVTV